MSEMTDMHKLIMAMKLAKTARVGMGLTYFDVIELLGELDSLKSYIAELEARLGLCESALVSMTYQFFYSSESGALVHSFMSAEEEAAEYLVDYGIARWENEHKNSIVFEEGALNAHIAELEAKFDQLTARWRQERQDDKWIPVSERLPDNWESVLTIDISKSTRDMVTAFYNPETSLWWSTHFSYDLWVTHWMPLPEPPIVYGKVCEE